MLQPLQVLFKCHRRFPIINLLIIILLIEYEYGKLDSWLEGLHEAKRLRHIIIKQVFSTRDSVLLDK